MLGLRVKMLSCPGLKPFRANVGASPLGQRDVVEHDLPGSDALLHHVQKFETLLRAVSLEDR